MRSKHSLFTALLVMLLALMLPCVAGAQTQTAPEGATWGDYQVQQSIEFGYRFSNDWQKGNYRTFDNYVNLHEGPRLLENTLSMRSLSHYAPLFDNLFVSTFGFGGDPNNVARVKISKNKWYNFSTAFRRDQNYFDYPQFGNPLNPTTAFTVPRSSIQAAASTYATPQFQDSGHSFAVRRRMSDFDLTLLPQSMVSVRMGYSRIRTTGPSYGSFHEGTDFLIGGNGDNTNTTGNSYRIGADFKLLPKTTISYDQTFDYFKNDTNYDLANSLGSSLVFNTYAPTGYTAQQINFGLPYYGAANNPCANFIVSTSGLANPQCSGLALVNPISGLPGYYKYQKTRTDTRSEQLSFVSRAIKNVDLTGRYLYSSADMNSPFSEDFYGAVTRTQERRWGQDGTAIAKAINNSAELSATIHLTNKFRIVEIFRFNAWRTPMFLSTNEWSYVPAKLNGKSSTSTNCLPGDVAAAGYTCAFLLEPVVGTGVTPAQALTAAQSSFGAHNSSTGADQGLVTSGAFLGQNGKWNTISAEYDFFKSFGARLGYRYGTRRDAEKVGYEVGTEYYYPNPLLLGTGTAAARRGNCSTTVPADVTQTIAANGVCTAEIDAALSEPELFDVTEHTALFGLWYRPSHNLRMNGEVEMSAFDHAVTRVSPRHQQHYRFRATYQPSSKATIAFTYNGLESKNPGVVVDPLPGSTVLNGTTYTFNPGLQPSTLDINYTGHSRNFGVSTNFAPSAKVSFDIAYNYSNFEQSNLVCPVYASTSLSNATTGIPASTWPNLPMCPIFPDQVASAEGSMTSVVGGKTVAGENLANGTFASTNHFVSFFMTLRPTKRFATQIGYSLSNNNGNMLVLSPWLGVGTPVLNPAPGTTKYLALPNTYGAPSSLASNYHMPSIAVSYELVKNWTAKAQWNYWGYNEGVLATGSGVPNNFHTNAGLVSLRYAF
jgi:hypothetical protein